MKRSTTFALIFLPFVLFAQGTQLLRQPTISDTEIVFVYANDLWKSSINGGGATRLTSNQGYEFSPHFSPDGSTIAFSLEINGNTDIYLLAAEGGEPTRLTWHPSADVVQGWTPNGEILFRSSRKARPTQTNKFYTVSTKGGLPKALDIPRAAFGEVSSDGKHIAYTPITSWDSEWRNYRGGQAMPIWIVDMETKELTTTSQPTAERHLDPIWHNGKVFFLSERDYASNIWSYDPATKKEEQHTFHKKFDVKSLDAHGNYISYEQGGYLHLLNTSTNKTKQLDIVVKGDMNFATLRWENVEARSLRNPQLSPEGKRVLFEYRGEIFSLPKEKGSWRNLTNTPGVADRSPVWSPKGDKIAWFSDATGEYALTIADQQGLNPKTYELPEPTFYFRPAWSPNGEHIAYSDTHYNIWVLHLSTGITEKVGTDSYAHPNRTMHPVWSPDSQWIAFSKQLNSHFKALFAYNITTKSTLQITDGMADAISPIWDESGSYLYFLASTDYGLQSGWLDMSSYDPQTTRSLYAVVLSSSGKSPTLPQSDEATVTREQNKEKDKKDSKSKDSKAAKSVKVVLDAQGIQDRIVALPLPARNYVALVAAPENFVFVAEAIPNEPNVSLHTYDVKKGKAEVFAKNMANMTVSMDRKKILFQQNGGWKIVSTSKKPSKDDIPLAMNIKMQVDPTKEYHQIFKEGWRYMRDFLYVDNVHGAPWDEVYSWYAPWIDHVRHRTDLNYVVDIMSGEVAIGHSYVYGGDFPDDSFTNTGLLGCDFELNNGAYQITKIYTGERWNPELQAPLALPGLEVKEGDYLVSINGKALSASTNPYSLLEQTAGREISLTLSNNANQSNPRTILVKPVRSESNLRTFDWIEGNRRKVETLSNGKLAYVYVPNTGGRGFQYFNRYYFSQQDKKGVIIDERNNGGGSAADYMIDVMSRELFGYFNSKTSSNRPWTTPIAGIWGPKVMLINERAGSGGDLLPYMFKTKKIGPLVGTRTWGGLVGTWDTPNFIDGGVMIAPRGGFFDADGNWAVEGEGVAPDITVIQEPKAVLSGKDPQLERGVQEALKLLETEEFELKPEPAAPVRWKRPAGFKKE